MWFSRFICAVFGHKLLTVFDDITILKPHEPPRREKIYWCVRCQSEMRGMDKR